MIVCSKAEDKVCLAEEAAQAAEQGLKEATLQQVGLEGALQAEKLKATEMQQQVRQLEAKVEAQRAHSSW